MDAEQALARAFLETHPADGARILERLDPEAGAAALAEAPPAVAASVLQRMASFSAAECLGRIAVEHAAEIATALPIDVAALLLRRVEAETRDRLLEAVSDAAKRTLGVLLRYPEDTAGALMDPRLLALTSDISVGEARARVRRAPQHVLYYLYVVDRAGVLVGVLNIRELMLAAPAEPLATVMSPSVASLRARADRATIVAHPGWRSYHALPVVDEAGVFLGAMRYETLRRLEDDARAAQTAPSMVATLLTLGELYWIGLSGMLTGLGSSIAAGRVQGPPRGAERRDAT